MGRDARVFAFGERAAADERVAGHVTRAAADWGQSSEVAVGADAAGAVARVLAYAVEAGGPSRRAVAVAVALSAALGVRGSQVEVLRAFKVSLARS